MNINKIINEEIDKTVLFSQLEYGDVLQLQLITPQVSKNQQVTR